MAEARYCSSCGGEVVAIVKPPSPRDAAPSKPVGAAEPRAGDAIRTVRTVMTAVGGLENVLMEPFVKSGGRKGKVGIRRVKARTQEAAEELRGLIESGEEVELLIAATLARPGRKGSGMLCITDRRMLLLEHGREPQAWDLDAITSPTMQASGLMSFQVGGKPFRLSKLTPATKADRVLSLLRRAPDASSSQLLGVNGKARVTVHWMSEEAPDAARVRIEGDFLGYAAAILDRELPGALQQIAKPDGGSWTVDVEGGRELPGHSYMAEPGRITITAQRLSETFDVRELRRCVQGCMNAAVEEGERRAASDKTRARRFPFRTRRPQQSLGPDASSARLDRLG